MSPSMVWYYLTSASPLLVIFNPLPAGVIKISTRPEPTNSCKWNEYDNILPLNFFAIKFYH
jgi:hypothetical protein